MSKAPAVDYALDIVEFFTKVVNRKIANIFKTHLDVLKNVKCYAII